jgi:putative serine protease PepD
MTAVQQPGSRAGRSAGQVLALAVIVAVVAAGVGALVGASIVSSRESQPAASTPVASTPGAAGGPAFCDAQTVATTVYPSLAEILASGPSGGATGSGSVIDSNGDVLTNDHVVAPGAGGRIVVNLARGPSGIQATIVGRDPLTDVAVVRVPASAGPFSVIGIGTATTARVGQPVVALGSPLGLSETVTAGILSALDRVVNVPAPDTTYTLLGAIQTDASINPGNSGGPLVDCDGRQIGMNSAGASLTGGNIGLNFAIPIDLAMSEAQEIVATGAVTHPSIGISGVTIAPEVAATTGLPRGVVVDQVVAGSPAATAGIQSRDVITQVSGTPVPTFVDFLLAMRAHKIGDVVAVTLVRSGATRTLQVTVADGTSMRF